MKTSRFLNSLNWIPCVQKILIFWNLLVPPKFFILRINLWSVAFPKVYLRLSCSLRNQQSESQLLTDQRFEIQRIFWFGQLPWLEPSWWEIKNHYKERKLEMEREFIQMAIRYATSSKRVVYQFLNFSWYSSVDDLDEKISEMKRECSLVMVTLSYASFKIFHLLLSIEVVQYVFCLVQNYLLP